MKKFKKKWTITNSVISGDRIKFTENVFAGSYRKPQYLGKRTIWAKVIKESYGVKKQQHTFTLEVIKCSGIDPIIRGKKIYRKGRNIYKQGVTRLVWTDEEKREKITEEKHTRGDKARKARTIRRIENNGFIII